MVHEGVQLGEVSESHGADAVVEDGGGSMMGHGHGHGHHVQDIVITEAEGRVGRGAGVLGVN